MKLPKACKVHEAAAKTASRFDFTNVYLVEGDATADVRTDHLVSTNGRIMAVLPVETDENDTPGPIPVEALKHATKGATSNRHGWTSCEVRLGENVEANNGKISATFKRPQGYGDTHSKWENVMKGAPVDGVSITFNPTLLLRLAKALGSTESVRLTINDTDDRAPIRVEPSRDEAVAACPGAFGAIMPIVVH